MHQILNIGHQREDISHVNAVRVHNNELLIGLNNTGKDSDTMSLNIGAAINNGMFEFDALDPGTLRSIKDLTNSHDIEPINDTILCCSSHKGHVLDAKDSKILINKKNWIRGLTASENYLWLGASMAATRKQRHNKSLAGLVHKYNLDDFTLIRSYKVANSGQINDIINVSAR